MDSKLNEGIIEQAMKSKDNFDLFIRTHIYAEYLINEAIKQNFPNHKAIDKWRYSSQIKILHALDWLPEVIFENLKVMAELRNKYAHNLEITESDVNGILGRLKSRFKRIHYPPESESIHYSYTEPVLDTLSELYHAIQGKRKPTFM